MSAIAVIMVGGVFLWQSREAPVSLDAGVQILARDADGMIEADLIRNTMGDAPVVLVEFVDFDVVRSEGDALLASTSSTQRHELSQLSQSSQASPSSLSFDVASVKPSDPGGVPGFPRFGLTQFSVSNATLEALIRFAYRVPSSHDVVGLPSWASDRFDIVASYPPGVRSERIARTPEMLQSLLHERFKLVVRTETREARVYALVLARADGRLGPRLKQSSVDPDRDYSGTRERPELGPAGESLITRSQENWPLEPLVDYLAGRLGQPVLDHTGLTGMFDYELTYAPATLRADAASIAEGPTLFAALQEQLGLRLESVRAPVDVLMVEHVERPDPD